MPPSTPQIINLANSILKDTEKLLHYFQSNGYPLPTFTVGSASRAPETEEYAAVQESLLASLKDLQYLIEGPKQTISTFLRLHHDLGAFQVAFEFDFFRLIPSEGDIDVAQLAQKAGLDEDIVCRMLRMLTTNRIFAENKPGHFSHTPLSILFHQDEEIRCIGEYVLVYPPRLLNFPYRNYKVYSSYRRVSLTLLAWTSFSRPVRSFLRA